MDLPSYDAVGIKGSFDGADAEAVGDGLVCTVLESVESWTLFCGQTVSDSGRRARNGRCTDYHVADPGDIASIELEWVYWWSALLHQYYLRMCASQSGRNTHSADREASEAGLSGPYGGGGGRIEEDGEADISLNAQLL